MAETTESIAIYKFFPLSDYPEIQAVFEREYPGLGDRTLNVTPVFADYGNPSMWILSVEGSPPKGTILWPVGADCPRGGWIIRLGKSKRLRGCDEKIVALFLARHC